MSTHAISNATIFDGRKINAPVNISFHASPGDIISIEAEARDLASFDTVIDGAGCTLLPAFIDANIDTAAAGTDLPTFASYGIGTVLDMSSTKAEIEIMRAESDTEVGLPTYLASGPIATAQTSQRTQIHPRRETGIIRFPAEAETFVLGRLDGPSKSDYIKVFVDLPGLDGPTLVALVHAAHRHGKLAVAHAFQKIGYSRALQAGFDAITLVPIDGVIDIEVANGLAARGIACVPTLCMARAMAELLNREAGDGTAGVDFDYALANVKKLYARVGFVSVPGRKQIRPLKRLYQLARVSMTSWNCLFGQASRTSTHFGQQQLSQQRYLVSMIGARFRLDEEQIWYWSKGIHYRISQPREESGTKRLASPFVQVMRKLLPKSQDQNPLPPPPDIARRKRVQTQVACEACRKRKTKVTLTELVVIFISQGASSPQARDLRLRGRMFADEALGMLRHERQHPSMTLLQGLIVLWIYEVNYGRKAQAIALLEEFYNTHSTLGLSDLTLPTMEGIFPSQASHSKEEWQVLSCIVWGFFCLEAKISLILSRAMKIRKPEIPKTFEDAYSSLFSNPEAPEYFWSPYPGDRQPQQSLYREAFSLECQLAVIIQETSRFFALTEPEMRVPNDNEMRAAKEKLQRWGTGALQRFLGNISLLPSILFLETTYEMVFLKLLHCPYRFPLQDDTDGSTTSTRASYGASIITNLWVYRATYGMRHEYWLMQACLEAATAIMFKLGDNPTLSKSMVMACQLLYSMGEFLPMANEYLLVIKGLARQQGVDLPKACRIFYSGLAVRTGRIIVKGPLLVNIGPGQDDMDVGPRSASSQEVVFSGLIQGIYNLAGESS
ncbi:hypothetical protein NM208_g4187 [Fusarium decemcellulare]|uniref:Uncharacterized protein n=1 Tax=Fusarium decemcellulare TaxID=57161 RepID=A0ACC1SLF3_9HYPO|nr:hypothetical protein NM208_g4187 [Fusarium decemcellulare]